MTTTSAQDVLRVLSSKSVEFLQKARAEAEAQGKSDVVRLLDEEISRRPLVVVGNMGRQISIAPDLREKLTDTILNILRDRYTITAESWAYDRAPVPKAGTVVQGQSITFLQKELNDRRFRGFGLDLEPIVKALGFTVIHAARNFRNQKAVIVTL